LELQSMKIRDRVIELRRVPASQLQPNPRNWRTHPQSQQDALRGILAEVGYADALLARETPEGGLMLIDGHLRAETTPEAVVPVLVLDVDEAEAAKILATLDPLAAMAEADSAKLDQLLRGVETGSAALREMLAQLAARSETFPPDEDGPAEGADRTPEPQLATKFAVIVNCETEQQQLQLLEQFESQGLDCRALVV
jgi:hypothetical protein